MSSPSSITLLSFYSLVLLVLTTLCSISSPVAAKNGLLNDFEFLSSDKISYTYAATRRNKRSALYSQDSQDCLADDLIIDITLKNEKFKLLLSKEEPPIVHWENVTVNGVKIDVDRYYEGFVSGYPSSLVTGYINSRNAFEGLVTIGNDSWMIESSDLVWEDEPDMQWKAPTIAFKETDLDKSNFAGVCGNNDGVFKIPDELKLINRSYRAIEAAPEENTCEILVVVDHTFSAAYKDKVVDITQAIAYFVKEADNIFRASVFGDKIGYHIKIGRFEVFTSDMVNDDSYPFKGLSNNIGSSQFLTTLADKSRKTSAWNKYCLVYAFTNRDFNNVLGEAYTGSIGGGICKDYKQGIVTMKLQGDRRSKLLIALTFAHEVGHSWGSGHDSGKECAPGGIKGNYLMHPSSQPGIYENNPLFSLCSRAQIANHLAKAGSTACFQPPLGDFCGNNVVEGSEKCDCGFENDDGNCYDKCCFPASAVNYRNNECQLKGNSVCSPTFDECCDGDSCGPKPAGTPCGLDDECAMPRECPGGAPFHPCPKKENSPDGKLCRKDTKSCVAGNCVGSACAALGAEYESCSCKPELLDDPATIDCVVCCKRTGEVGSCQPIHKIDAQRRWPTVLYVGDGDSCTSNEGYCDVYHRCRSFVEEGLLLTAITRLFSKERWSDFVTQYWWAIALLVMALIVTMFCFVHFCAIYTPTQNPNVKEYRGPAQYAQKKYSTMKTRRSEPKDSPDGTGKPKKQGMKMTNKRRIVVPPPNELQKKNSKA